MSEHPISNLMDTTMERLRSMVDANTIIGTPIEAAGITVIPISKVSFGLATGGSDIPNKNGQQIFGGGGGAGVSVTPIAFIAIKDGNAKLLQIYNEASSVDRAIQMAPELFDRIKDLFPSNKE